MIDLYSSRIPGIPRKSARGVVVALATLVGERSGPRARWRRGGLNENRRGQREKRKGAKGPQRGTFELGLHTVFENYSSACEVREDVIKAPWVCVMATWHGYHARFLPRRYAQRNSQSRSRWGQHGGNPPKQRRMSGYLAQATAVGRGITL